MKKRYGDQVEFIGVYVREAHPTDGWRMESNDKAGVTFAQPKTKEDREAIAAKCCSTLKMTIPLLVDGLDDAVGRAYSGMPDRLYLIDKHGRIAYKGGRGPFGFKPGELEQSIIMNLLEERPIEKASQGPADLWKLLPKAEATPNLPLPNWAAALAPAMPKTVAAMLELDYLHRAKSPLPAKLRAKMRWVAAHANRCPQSEAAALADLRRAGADEAEIKALTGSEKNWPESERAALTFADKLTREAYKVLDEEVLALRKQYGDANVVAMVQLLAYSNFQDRLIHSLGLPMDESATAAPLNPKFKHPYTDAAEPAKRALPASERETQAAKISDPEWRKFDFAELKQLMDRQKAREPRIPVPPFESVRKYMPPNFPKDKELRIRWSLVCTGYQPQLASAWSNCTRNFGEEAKQDRVFEESLFWVVTRSLQCFY